MKKENPVLQVRPTQILHFGPFFFSFFSLLKPWKQCKTSCFSQSQRKIWLNVFGNNWKIFFQNFSQKKKKKCQTFGKLYCFIGESFLPAERKKNIKKEKKRKCPDQPYLESPSARKTVFFIFFYFFFLGLSYKDTKIKFWKYKAITPSLALGNHYIYTFNKNVWPG